MDARRVGAGGPLVGAVGLGCMGMSWAYSGSVRDDEASTAVLHAALDLGVTFFDTADVYGAGHNEELVGRALGVRRGQVTLATKVGLIAEPAGSMRRDGSPAHIAAAVDASLLRLGTDVIDLYYLHRVDPSVPLAETWEAMAALVAAGKVRRLGLSEVTVAQAALAHALHPVAAVQSEFSLWTRDPLGAVAAHQAAGAVRIAGTAGDADSGDVVAWCAENGVAFVPFAPLGRGFLTGAITAATGFEAADLRSAKPRFASKASKAGRAVDVVRTVAARHRATPAQVAIAWVLGQGDHVVPIPGTKHRRYLTENVGAASLRLTLDDLADLDGSG